MRTYGAPWGKMLRWSSAGIVVLAAVLFTGTSWLPVATPPWAAGMVRFSLPLILLACLPFVVRGYAITEDAILIRRLFWTTRLDRAGLSSAEVVPRALGGSLRTCGNGGAFSFTGWYWSKRFGAFRAYVTDLNRTVVLRFGGRTVIVSPGEPEDFVEGLNRR